MLRLGLVCVRQFMSVSMCATVCINWSRRHLTEGFSPQKPLTMAGLQLGSVCACVLQGPGTLQGHRSTAFLLMKLGW